MHRKKKNELAHGKGCLEKRWKNGMEKRKEKKENADLKYTPSLLFNLDARRKSILPFDTQSESRRIKRAEINSENIFDGVACSLSAKWTAKWNK